MNKLNKNPIDIITHILGIFNYIIDLPVMLIEEIIRRIKPKWEWTPFTLTPYYFLIAMIASYILISKAKFGWLILCVILMTAIELQAFWKCVLLALGRSAIIYPQRIGFTKKERPIGGRKLLTKTSFYMGISAFGFSIYYYAFLFLFIFKTDSSSFHGIKATYGIGRLWEFFYFSFITITTVGYGDIYPKSFFARSFVMLENITGIFFVVFLFTIFVSYHFKNLQKQNK